MTVRSCSTTRTGGPPPCSPGMLRMVADLLASRAWRALPRCASAWPPSGPIRPATDDTPRQRSS
jgi:hypothetical protein